MAMKGDSCSWKLHIGANFMKDSRVVVLGEKKKAEFAGGVGRSGGKKENL